MVNKKRDEKGRFMTASGKSEGTEGEMMRVMSALVSRMELANRAGLQFEGARDLYKVFGYKTSILPEDMLAKYARQDIASRIVDAPPGATWSNPPEIEEGNPAKEPFEVIRDATDLWTVMYRADRLARMNPFSLMLFGLDDTGNLKTPAKKASEVLYVRAIGSRQVTEVTYVNDPKNKRFGLPENYKITFDDPTSKTSNGTGTVSAATKDLIVHHSRIVHIADGTLEDTIYGHPMIERCFNLLDDLLKVSGGTAETYWLTGNRGMQADIDKEMDLEPGDAAALKDEIEEYMHQLSRIIKTRGVKLNVLDSNTPAPHETFEMIMSLLSGTTGIPRRILLGSEAGQLASEQDRANWAERIEERRALFVNPSILKPTVALLQNVGLLPEGKVEWEWPSAFIQNPLEEGQTMAQIARAVGNLSRQTGNQTPMQLLSEEESREVIGFSGPLPKPFEPKEYQMPDPVPTGAPEDGIPGDGTRSGKTKTEQDKSMRAEKQADERSAGS